MPLRCHGCGCLLSGGDIGDPLRCIHSSIWGVGMMQAWAGLFWLDATLRHFQPETIVEIGTGEGATALFMAPWVEPGRVLTIDLNDYRQPRSQDLFERFEIEFWFRNAHDGGRPIAVAEWLTARPGKLLLLCDGGSKTHDFEAYVPLTKPGDVIVVHDVGAEFYPDSRPGLDERQLGLLARAEAVIEQYGLDRWERENEAGLFAAWVRR